MLVIPGRPADYGGLELKLCILVPRKKLSPSENIDPQSQPCDNTWLINDIRAERSGYGSIPASVTHSRLRALVWSLHSQAMS